MYAIEFDDSGMSLLRHWLKITLAYDQLNQRWFQTKGGYQTCR